MNIAFIGNQGGDAVLGFYAGMAVAVRDKCGAARCIFLPWLNEERASLSTTGFSDHDILTFEDWVARRLPFAEEVARLRRDYNHVNWSAVVASERAFTDYSLLLGSAGHRAESSEYIQRLLVNIVTFLEFVFNGQNVQAVVCQTADTLFSHVVFKVAKHLGIKVFAVTPALLLEEGAQGGHFTSNEWLESNKMLAHYKDMSGYTLSEGEVARVNSFVAAVKGFKNKTSFVEENRERKAGLTALSPNVYRLLPYLRKNSRRDSDVEYIKVSPLLKVQANLIRLVRKFFNRNMFGRTDTSEVPAQSVFFAFQYQPEQSTLSQGLWYVNQIALAENISKSLPLGYTLILKEHPWGRGARPTWQYRHLSGLYNIRFCDAPSKDIIAKVAAVICISGTVGFESMVLDKPTIILGRSFYTYCDLLYRLNSIQELPGVLRRILINGEYAEIPDRPERLNRFLLSYLKALIPYFPTLANASHYGEALIAELVKNESPAGKNVILER